VIITSNNIEPVLTHEAPRRVQDKGILRCGVSLRHDITRDPAVRNGGMTSQDRPPPLSPSHLINILINKFI